MAAFVAQNAGLFAFRFVPFCQDSLTGLRDTLKKSFAVSQLQQPTNGGHNDWHCHESSALIVLISVILCHELHAIIWFPVAELT